MEKRKFTIKEKVALIVIAVLIVAAIVVGAVLIVGNTNKAQNELLNTEHTTVEITLPETEAETYADSTEKKADDNTENTTKSKTTSSKTSSPETKSATEKNDNNSSSTKSKTSKTSKNPSKNVNPTIDTYVKPDKIVPTVNETHASDDICTVNGKKCHVGDTITMAINLKTPVILENYQGFTNFDDSYLEYIALKMNSGGIYNEKHGVIYYNASILSGIDFTSEGTIYTATFKVKKAGSTEIRNTLQILTDQNDVPVKLRDCKEQIKIFD